jgi:hypothetical protein
VKVRAFAGSAGETVTCNILQSSICSQAYAKFHSVGIAIEWPVWSVISCRSRRWMISRWSNLRTLFLACQVERCVAADSFIIKALLSAADCFWRVRWKADLAAGFGWGEGWSAWRALTLSGRSFSKCMKVQPQLARATCVLNVVIPDHCNNTLSGRRWSTSCEAEAV